MTPRSAQGNQTGLRPASSLASVSNLLLGDPELPPFSVEPSVGLIQPGTNQNLLIRFSPLKVNEYEGRLLCRSAKQTEQHMLNIISTPTVIHFLCTQNIQRIKQVLLVLSASPI